MRMLSEEFELMQSVGDLGGGFNHFFVLLLLGIVGLVLQFRECKLKISSLSGCYVTIFKDLQLNTFYV